MDDSRTQSDLGVLLKNHRRSAGLTQRHLADLTAVSVRAIRNLEQGKVLAPRPDTLHLLADGLRLRDPQRHALLDAARRRPAVDDPDPADGCDAWTPWIVRGPLIGRDTEISALTELLGQPGGRLVGVVGVGGVGKSHLAAETVRRMSADGTPVLWCARGQHVSAAELGRRLTSEHAILVLDDAELPLAAVGRVIALMRSHPRLHVLFTGPWPWGVPGEQVLRLGPLPVPAPDAGTDLARLGEVPSARLLYTHIRASHPQFRPDGTDAAVVAELCRQLDGLPRALEFAGRWTAVRTLPQLLAEVERSPFALTAPPMTTDHAGDLRVRLRRTLSRLGPADVSLLAAVARERSSWTVAEAAAKVRVPEADAEVIAFTLLSYGLIRPEARAGGGLRFSVLNHVRYLYAEGRPAGRSRPLAPEPGGPGSRRVAAGPYSAPSGRGAVAAGTTP